MLRAVLVGGMFTCASLLLGQANVRAPANLIVTITPAKAVLFAGERLTFVASVVGTGDKSVSWTVEQEEGGIITDSGLYRQPRPNGLRKAPGTQLHNHEGMRYSSPRAGHGLTGKTSMNGLFGWHRKAKRK